MTNEVREKIIKRNKEIITEVKREIDKKCPKSVDMIAVTGSFANGNFYEKSDLDLLILKNDNKADDISTCFIMDDIGYDIYTRSWSDLEETSKYKTPYVSKLKNLDIVYSKDSSVSERYKELQQELEKNMNDENVIKENISNSFAKAITNYGDILNTDSLESSYKSMGKFMIAAENIIYFMNNTYVKNGVKNIPEEIKQMKNLPKGFLENYLKLPNASTTTEIIEYTSYIFDSIKTYMENNNIEIRFEEDKEPEDKQELTFDSIKGSYEELYSNYFNKIIHSSETNNKYSSFRTMVDAQSFLDEYVDKFDMPSIDLVGSYNPDSLVDNSKSFGKVLDQWKDLYDGFNKRINVVGNVTEIYDTMKPFIAFDSEALKEFMKKPKSMI